MTAQGEYRHDITEQVAYELLLAYWRGEATRFGGPALATEDEVAAYVEVRKRSSAS